MIRAVAIISNPKSKNVKEVTLSAISFLKRYNIDVMLEQRTAEAIGVKWHTSREEIVAKSDFFVVIGGDGTVLSAARLAGEKEIPILAIHLGRLGFIAEFNPSELEAILGTAMEGKLPLHRRMRVECEIYSAAGECIFKAHALNEVALSKGGLARMIDFEVSVDGELINSYRADGFLVSTPTGSTGYSLSTGGPIVEPDMRLMILSPICSHSVSSRVVIVPAESIINIKITEERQDIFVSQDGQVGRNLQVGESLVVRQTSFDTLLYHMPGRNFYEHLRNKLGWGNKQC